MRLHTLNLLSQNAPTQHCDMHHARPTPPPHTQPPPHLIHMGQLLLALQVAHPHLRRGRQTVPQSTHRRDSTTGRQRGTLGRYQASQRDRTQCTTGKTSSDDRQHSSSISKPATTPQPQPCAAVTVPQQHLQPCIGPAVLPHLAVIVVQRFEVLVHIKGAPHQPHVEGACGWTQVHPPH